MPTTDLSAEEISALQLSNTHPPVANRRETILGLLLSFGVLAIIAVVLRLYARFKLAKRPGWDDALVVLSLASATTGGVFLCLASYSGLGKHFATLSLDTMRDYLFRFYVANATYVFSTAILKLSLLCQYLRIFKESGIRTGIWTLIALCTVWGSISCFMAWFPCFPIKAYWDPTRVLGLATARCYAYGSSVQHEFVRTYVAHSAFNLVLDFAVLVLPAPVVFQRAMTKKEKLSALGLGILGSLVIVMCAWRLGEMVQHKAGFTPYVDFSWWAPIMVLLAALEVNIAILAVSCPVFWPIVESHFYGIIVRHEVQVTSHQISGFENLEDGDGKSEHGSEAELAKETRRAKSAKDQPYYTEELALEPLGLGENNVSIRGRGGPHSSWLDTTP